MLFQWPETPIRFFRRALVFVLIPFLILVVIALPPKPSLFLIEAETSRFQYRVETERALDNAGIFVTGARVQVGAEFLYPANSDGQEPLCYSGEVQPLIGTTVEFRVDGGVQVLNLSRSDQTPVGTLTQDISMIETGDDVPGSMFVVGINQNQPSAFVLDTATSLIIDPDCKNVGDTGDVVGFGLAGDLININGFGQIGRRTLADGQVGTLRIDRFPAFAVGHVDLMVRSGLCRRFLRLSCNRLLRINAAPFVIPAGGTIQPGWARPRLTEMVQGWGADIEETSLGSADQSGSTPAIQDSNAEKTSKLAPGKFVGHAYFDGARYHVNASVDAVSLLVLQPNPNSEIRSFDRLRASALERLLAEPILTGLGSLIITIVGVLLGLEQITSHRPGPTTNARVRPLPVQNRRRVRFPRRSDQRRR